MRKAGQRIRLLHKFLTEMYGTNRPAAEVYTEYAEKHGGVDEQGVAVIPMLKDGQEACAILDECNADKKENLLDVKDLAKAAHKMLQSVIKLMD